ncbi:MAG TPA: peptidoglycan DD-metalloendopeptidase family protein [Marmoricola sp.]|jgi:murein DD-endopeptidase MepM/ murein hydrolase activator NlpD|nr:peptidoglycan DD-metalloendopeptidase family protein [Marmoricola sp.]
MTDLSTIVLLAGLLAAHPVPAVAPLPPGGPVAAVLAVERLLDSDLPAPQASRAPTITAVWPLDPQPEVVTGFLAPSSTWGPGHRGVDLLGAPGQPVRAAVAGTVTFAGSLAGRGVVVVTSGARRTTYEPVLASVHVGDQVEAGTTIGGLEPTPSHCAPRSCLHWGLIEGSVYLDPLTLLGGAPVRLYPVG